MNIVVFGLGRFYENRKNQMLSYPDIKIVAYTDNEMNYWGKCIDGIKVISPLEVKNIDYDIILIMSTYMEEIYWQLIGMGIARKKIKIWEVFCVEVGPRVKQIFYGLSSTQSKKGKILIITAGLIYDGGSLAAIYAAIALKKRGYDVIVSAPEGDSSFIDEAVKEGITIYLCPSLPYINDVGWIKQFDIVLVNVFQMLQAVLATDEICPTLWWIHEPAIVFDIMLSEVWNCVSEKDLVHINIYAVSRKPRENFYRFYPNKICKILHYGIPDITLSKNLYHKKIPQMVFAIIGSICETKAQDIFCRAVEELNNQEHAEFWIIGRCAEIIYDEKIRKMTNKVKSIKMIGELTREKIYEIFPCIDVIVCPSREDSLPIVVTEGMMFGKVCIVSDTTGTADFIQDGENGFIIPSEDINALKVKLEWILDNQDKLADIGKKARKTYEKYFTMDVFAENLEKAILETKTEWHSKRNQE